MRVGEKQLESDRREMKKKISDLNRDIDSVRRHRAMQRLRRRRLGLPVVALVGMTGQLVRMDVLKLIL